jgi:HlyD family secretion protein
MRKRMIVLTVLLLAAGVSAYLYLSESEGLGRFSIGHNGDDRIQVSGNIELTEVNIAFKTAGRLIERTIDEGDVVKKGQEIARLDRDQLLAQRDRETAGLQSANSQLAQAETALAWQRENWAADLEQRKADLASYQARLQELKNGSRPQEIQEAKAAVESAQAEWERAKRDWDRAQTLYKNDDISTAQYDQYRSRWESSEAALKQARERQALVLAGPRVEQIEAASAQVQRARAAIKMAETNALEIKRREQELPMRRAEIARAKANIALIDSQLADTIAVSPVDGVVLVKSADVGEVLAAGVTVVTIGDIEHPWLRAYINETDLGRVKLGTRANITTDSYPGKVYEGRVSFIASEAEFTPKQIQTQEERVKLVYRIKIEVDNPHHELKSNMPADAQIVLEQ